MKEYLPKKYVFVLCVSLLIFFAPSAFASHAVGIDLTYSCLGGNQYEFTVNFYRDCAGIGAPTVATISISSASCGISTSVDLPLISSQEVSAICPAQQGNSTCNGGSLPGIEQYVYRGTYTFPAQCSDWVIGYTMCCRNSAITNLQSPDSRNIYVQANLNNTAGLCNNSPFFTSLPVPYLCSGQPFFYNHGAVDLDGDSLVYTLVNALDGPGVNIPYNGGRTPTSPLNTTGPFGFDTQTGQMSFTPSGTQQAVVTVLVQEYRNGVLIGSTIRDLQLVVINCTNNLPTATGIDGSGNFSVSICAGYPLCFNIYTNDIDANQTTTINWNGGIQGGSFSATGSPFQTGTFCWTPTIADIGPHNFSVEVSDNACPIPGLNIYNYNVYVVPNPNPPINAGPDVSICQGNCTNLNATTAASGPIVYSWYPTTGLSCTNCPNPTACPSVTTIYTVTATYPDACASTDEVQVTVNPTPTVSVYPTSASICSGGSITLSASGSPTAATYTWNPGGLSGSTVTVSPSANTTYTVTAYDATGCPSLPATSVISLNPPPPSAVCNNIYVTTTGTGGGLSPTDPTSLANALTIGACNNVTIKMAIGTYYINSAINNITSYMTLEGGFDPTNNWAKSSQPGLTTIYRNDNNYDGPANAQRLVAIYLNTLQYVRFQDITIQTANVSSPSASGYGVSNYGVHLTACSNYDFVRTQIICGNASGGANGADYSGQRAASGSNGSAGTDGSDVSCNAGTGGAGGGGASGANAGAAGSAGITPGGCPASNGNGGSGGTSTSYRDGGGGGGGGGGGRSDGNGGQGGNGGGVNGGGGTSGGGGGAGVSSAFASVGGSGANGANGANGASGGNGANGTPGLFSGGFYTPGAQGGNGGDGQGGTGGGGGGGGGGNYCSLCGNPDASGNGGGGGGGGGQGGLGGGGGYGGGAPIAVYLYNNGANSNFTDCNVTVGASGAGGTGGAGMLGGFAGVGGPGSVFGSYAGNGGNGGNGGAGGNGGTGGSAYGGSAVLVYQDGGAAPNTQTYGFALSGQPVINVSNVSCTNNDVTFSAANSSNWSYGSGSNPSTGSGASVITQYTTTGRKDVVFSANNYAGFANIAINNATFLPDITTSALPTGTPNTYYVCAGSSVNFYSSTLATTYAWDMGGGTTPNTYSTQNVLGAVFNTPGTYIISLQVTTDCCGLSNPNSITLIVEPYPTITLSGDSIICEGESTTITASGAVTYSWSPNLYVSATSGSVVTFNPPVTTTYVITGYNTSGNCTFTRNLTITVNANPILNTSTVSATCSGNGSATVVASAGSGSYTYAWNDPAAQITATAINLASGNYGVTVTDANTGCQNNTFAFVAAVGTPIVYIQNSVNVACFGGSTGRATAAGTNGTTPYSYAWSNGPFTALNSNLAAGSYTVTLTDANGCSATVSVSISQPDSLFVAAIDSTPVSCYGGNNGSATVLADGGQGGYSYAWNTSPVQTGTIATGLTAGTYTAVVLDGAGCTATTTVTINTPTALSLTTNSITNLTCFNANDGAIDVTGSGGTPPYTYALNGGPSQPTGQFSSLAAATYTLTLTDANGCDSNFTVIVTQPAQLSLSLVQDSVECFGGSDGAITATANGGTSPYQYAINGGPLQVSNTFGSLAVGNYSISVEDANGCSAVNTIDVLEPTQLSLSLVQDSVECFGGNDGSITATGGGGSLPYEYSINGGAYQSSNVLSSLSAGNYTVTIRDGNGCTVSQAIDVLQPTQLTLALVQDSVECFGGNDGSITATGGGGSLPYEYSINGGTYQSSNVLSSLSAGNYTVTIRDGNGCTVSQAIDVLQPSQLTLALVQ
ncbi:MAG: hypothetical protein SFW35_08490, partial [Chitinophagales bacterium]|nr:hypothetical protein [Chitinophagales bacterium]